MFVKNNVMFLFTCMEMRDSEQPSSCACGPAELVAQTRSAAFQVGAGTVVSQCGSRCPC